MLTIQIDDTHLERLIIEKAKFGFYYYQQNLHTTKRLRSLHSCF
jgi:hypothetical protein